VETEAMAPAVRKIGSSRGSTKNELSVLRVLPLS